MVTGTTTHTGLLVEAVAENLAGLFCLTAVLQPVDPAALPMAALMSFGRGAAGLAERDALHRSATPGALYTVRSCSQKIDGRCLYLLGAHKLQPLFAGSAVAQAQQPSANAAVMAAAATSTDRAAA